MSDLSTLLMAHQKEFASIIRFNPGTDKLIPLEFTSANKYLTGAMLEDTAKFTEYINVSINSRGARYGIGGYAEHRTIYSRSRLFDDKFSEEPRRLHLGLDIWGKPHEAVFAPMDGLIHSFAFNDSRGDYGATIILSHQLESTSFYTLYGHLSLNSIRNLVEGERVVKGDCIAEFGIPAENGQWPPHLHFQVIQLLGDWKGDYPGVCKFSEREIWLKNCPDPDLVANLNRFL